MKIKCSVCGTINEENMTYCTSCLQPLKKTQCAFISNGFSNVTPTSSQFIEEGKNRCELGMVDFQNNGYETMQGRQSTLNSSFNNNEFLNTEKQNVGTYSKLSKNTNVEKGYKEQSTLLLLFLYSLEFILVFILIEIPVTFLLSGIIKEGSLFSNLFDYGINLLVIFVALFMLLKKKVPRDPNIFGNTLLVLVTLFYTFLTGIQLYLNDVTSICLSEYIKEGMYAFSLGCFCVNMANFLIKKTKNDGNTNKGIVVTNCILIFLFLLLLGIGLYAKANGIMVKGYYV